MNYDPDEAKRWLSEDVDSAITYVRILRYFASTSTSESNKSRYSIKISTVEQILPVDVFEQKLKQLDRSNLSDIELGVLDAFWLAVSRRNAGKPDLEGSDLWVHERNCL